MGTVMAIGALVAVQGFGLAGARVSVADNPDAVREAWRTMPDDVAVVILTQDAQNALGDLVYTRSGPFIAITP